MAENHVFSACCFRTYGLTSQERGGAVQTEMSLAQIRSDGLKSEEETFPDVSAALRRGIVKKKDRIYVRWTLGQTGHGWRSGLDGDWEWGCLCLPACLPAAAWARTKGQGAAASSLSIEIRRFAYSHIAIQNVNLAIKRGNSCGNEAAVFFSVTDEALRFGQRGMRKAAYETQWKF